MKIKIPFNKDKVFFTSDTHFCHSNIIKFCNRPHTNVEEMNKDIVTLWNNIVPEDGIVFHLGDFSFGSSQSNRWIKDSLNGSIHFIMGNHDRIREINKLKFESVSDLLEITIEDEEIDGGFQKLILCHYPIASFNGAHKGNWHLFGHCHGTFVHHHPAAIDVGVDCWEFSPVSYEDVKIYLTKQEMKKKFKPVDHHE